MATKIDREVASDEKMLSTKSYNPLITWIQKWTGWWFTIRIQKLKSHMSFCSRGLDEVTRQIKNVMLEIPRGQKITNNDMVMAY